MDEKIRRMNFFFIEESRLFWLRDRLFHLLKLQDKYTKYSTLFDPLERVELKYQNEYFTSRY